MRDLIRIVESMGRSVPAALYHATSSTRLPAIVQHGLVPQPSQDNPDRVGIYLTDDPQVAKDYFEVILDRRGGDPVLLRIDGTRLDPARFEPDDYELRDQIADWQQRESDEDEEGSVTGLPLDPRLAPYQRWQDVPWPVSLAVTRQVFYTGTIPLSLIKRLI